jgi:acyl-CoA reductase-like NAD-dependent aldehyde dehydrogenase
MPDYLISGPYLAEKDGDQCTCAGGTIEASYIHEPACGFELVGETADIVRDAAEAQHLRWLHAEQAWRASEWRETAEHLEDGWAAADEHRQELWRQLDEAREQLAERDRRIAKALEKCVDYESSGSRLAADIAAKFGAALTEGAEQ